MIEINRRAYRAHELNEKYEIKKIEKKTFLEEERFSDTPTVGFAGKRRTGETRTVPGESGRCAETCAMIMSETFKKIKDKVTNHSYKDTLLETFCSLPIGQLKGYNLKDAVSDLISGLTVAFVRIPQGMAYAFLAGVQPQYGLYTGIDSPIIGPNFGPHCPSNKLRFSLCHFPAEKAGPFGVDP